MKFYMAIATLCLAQAAFAQAPLHHGIAMKMNSEFKGINSLAVQPLSQLEAFDSGLAPIYSFEQMTANLSSLKALDLEIGKRLETEINAVRLENPTLYLAISDNDSDIKGAALNEMTLSKNLLRLLVTKEQRGKGCGSDDFVQPELLVNLREDLAVDYVVTEAISRMLAQKKVSAQKIRALAQYLLMDSESYSISHKLSLYTVLKALKN